MMPLIKIYSTDASNYTQKSVSARILALFFNNLGLVVTRAQIIAVARDPITGEDRENWHQRLSELRTDKGYTILSARDTTQLTNQEYLMPHSEVRAEASVRVLPTPECWRTVLARADDRCEWREDGQPCQLKSGAIDPVGGGTVKLTPDHSTPHSVNPNSDVTDPNQWQALCGRHQVMKKNYWDSRTGKVNLHAILQSAGRQQKQEGLQFLLGYFGYELK